MKNLFQAIGAVKQAGKTIFAGTFPTVPANWPNRAVRRAIKQGHESRLPGEWRGFLAVNPDWRKAIMVNRLA
ncbi:hypothetical protein GNX71_18495 [Variovorax sp. RKNM96]|uniref:hypothetical protein n=1 Tax=Variovorax sp. RKNM96 TaxID=2681552 RepID=UPI00197D2F5C|nr:hypothetical protein [Variovorax sp. RKNM96]QSI31460.1 hypothetical protein GNX71_18495 [Variovorax sp. RKNM96]